MAPSAPAGRLTTHVLDTANGRPAAGVRVELFRCGKGEDRTPLADRATNEDGRCDGPLLVGAEMTAGTYEIRFHVGDYFKGASAGAAPFYDVVPVPFVISDALAHYHVPLIVSPFGYSTYRGS